jgi:hypothetical protein
VRKRTKRETIPEAQMERRLRKTARIESILPVASSLKPTHSNQESVARAS